MSVKLESIDAGPAAPTARLNPTAPQFAYKPTSRTLPPAPTTVSGPTPKTLPVVATASVKYESKVTYEASNPEAQAKMDAMGSYQSYKEWVDATIEDYLQPDGTIDLMGFYKASDRLTLLQTGFSADDVTQVENIVTIQTKLAPYTDSKGMVDLVAAINTGKMLVEDLKAVGFDPAEVDKAQTSARAMRVLAGENYHALNCINPDGTVDVVKAAGAGLRQELEVFGVSPAEFRNAQVLSQFRVGDSNQYDFPSAVAWLAQAKPGEVQVSPTPREVADAFGYTENQVKIMVRLEQKYKTPDGYNIAAAVDDPLIGSQSSADFQIVYDSFGKEAVDAAIAQARLLNTMGNLTYDEALKAGVISSADLVTLGAFKTDVEAKKYQTLVQTLSKIQGTKYESPEGFDLVGIIRDKALAPGEVQLLFGPKAGDETVNVTLENGETVTLAQQKKDILAQSRAIAHTKQVSPPKGLAQSLWWGVTPWKEEQGESYLDYVTDAEGNKHYLKGVVAGELIAAQTVGPFLLALVPGGIAGTGAAIGGRAAATGVTLSRIAGAGMSLGFAGMGAYGFYETGTHWKEMSDAQIGFNLSMSALAMLPALGLGRKIITRAGMSEYQIKAKAVKQALGEPIPEPKRPSRQVLLGERSTGGKLTGKVATTPVKLKQMRLSFVRDLFKGQDSVSLGQAFRNMENGLGRRSYKVAVRTFGRNVADQLDLLYRTQNALLDAHIARYDALGRFKGLSEKMASVDRRIARVGKVASKYKIEALDKQIAELGYKLNMLDDSLQTQLRRGKGPDILKKFGIGQESAIEPQRLSVKEFGKRDLALSIKNLADAITGENGGNLTKLWGDVVKARANLKFAQASGHPAPDLLLDLVHKESLYNAAKVGNVAKLQAMYQDINGILDTAYESKRFKTAKMPSREEVSALISVLEREGKTPAEIMEIVAKTRKLSPSRYAFLPNGTRISETQLARLELVARDVGKQLAQMLEAEVKTGEPLTGKILEARGDDVFFEAPKERQTLVWENGKYKGQTVKVVGEPSFGAEVIRTAGEPQVAGRGRGGTITMEPPTETSTSTSLVNLAKLKAQSKPVFAYAPGAGLGVVTNPRIETEIRTTVHGAVINLVSPSERLATENVLMNAISTGLQLEGANRVEMSNAIENALQQELATSTELSTKLQLKLETKLKTLVRTAVKIAVKIKSNPRIFPPILPPKPGVTKGTEKEQDIPSSAAGWKQGAFYWHIWPDGDKLAKRATLQPVEGISYKEGIGSAYDTLRKTHEGKLPKLMAMDMGIMDVYVSGEGETPKMRVRQDLYRRTRLGYVEGNPSMSRMK